MVPIVRLLEHRRPDKPRLLMGDLAKVSDNIVAYYRAPMRSTALRTFGECPRYYFYQYRLGLTRPSYRSAFFLGALFHKFVEARTAGEDVPDPELIYANNIDTLVELADDIGLLPDGQAINDVLEQMHIDVFKAWAMANVLVGDDAIWPLIPKEHDIITVEQQITAKVDGIGLPITGRLDVVTRDERGDLWIQDYKTTSYKPHDLAAAVSFDLQPDHYHLLALARYPDNRIAGVVHNIVMKPTIKYCPRTKDKGGAHSYLERVQEWYKERIAKGGDHMPLLRSKTLFGMNPRDDVLRSDHYKQLRRATRSHNGQPHPRDYPKCCNMHRCIQKGKVCQYIQLCRNDSLPAWMGIMHKFEQVNPSDPD